MIDVAFFAALTPWHWVAFALLILLAELLTGSTYLLWPAAAAGLTALIAWITPGAWAVHLAVFAILAVGLTWIGPRYVRGRWLAPKDDTQLNERAAQLVGRVGEATGPFVNGIGAVKLGDTVWRAQSQDTLNAGDGVEVVAAEGVTVTVKRKS